MRFWNININEQYKQHKYNVTLSCVRVPTFCCGTAISSSDSECVFVALVIQHAKRMRHILLSSVACLAVYFSTFSSIQLNFRKKFLNTIYFFLFSLPLLSETFHIVGKI